MGFSFKKAKKEYSGQKVIARYHGKGEPIFPCLFFIGILEDVGRKELTISSRKIPKRAVNNLQPIEGVFEKIDKTLYCRKLYTFKFSAMSKSGRRKGWAKVVASEASESTLILYLYLTRKYPSIITCDILFLFKKLEDRFKEFEKKQGVVEIHFF